MIKKLLTWEYLKRVMDFVQFLMVVGGVLFTVIQVHDMRDNQLHRQSDLTLKYYDRLTTGTNRKVMLAIAENGPLLLSQGGKFIDDDLDSYLSDLEDIPLLLKKGLLDRDFVCSDFSDLVNQAWNDKYVQEYVKASQKRDPTYFIGFEQLHQQLQNCR